MDVVTKPNIRIEKIRVLPYGDNLSVNMNDINPITGFTSVKDDSVIVTAKSVKPNISVQDDNVTPGSSKLELHSEAYNAKGTTSIRGDISSTSIKPDKPQLS